MIELRDYQKECVQAGLDYCSRPAKTLAPAVVVGPTGCHEKGYGILMFDGSIKKVEDIQVGDKVMGDDGTERNVIQLHRGIDEMYKIIPNKGKPFVVNRKHVLSLYKTKEGQDPWEKARIDEITVEEYVSKTKWYKHIHKLRYSSVEMNFDSQQLIEIDPYFIGLYIGDGSSISGSVSITTQRVEVLSYLIELAHFIGLEIKSYKKNNGTNKALSFVLTGEKGGRSNPIQSILRNCGLFKHGAGSKFIPDNYKYSNIENRRKLLAGLLDTDAYYDSLRNGYEYSTKSHILANDIVFLCRSLGLRCSDPSPKKVNGETYYRMNLIGDMRKIPIKVGIRQQSKEYNPFINQFVTKFEVDKLEKGRYYGFQLDGNNLYCDEQFFIHHNCGKSLIIGELANNLKGNTLVLQPSVELLKQNFEKSVMLGGAPSIYSASLGMKDVSRYTYATLGSVKKDIPLLKTAGITNLIIDECHYKFSPEKGSEFDKFVKEMGFKRCIGFTATPFRLASYSQLLGENYSQLNMLTRMKPRFFSKIIKVVQIQEMINRGYWSPLVYERWSFDNSRLVLNTTGSEFTERSIMDSIQANGVNNTIYKRLRELIKERKSILVFLDSVENCNKLSEFFNAKVAPVTAVVHAKTPAKKREKIINDFKEGKIKVLLNVQVLSVGFDHPGLDCIIMGKPTFSLAVLYQVYGRAVRIDPTGVKKDCLIIDAVDNTSRFGRIEDLTIENLEGYGWGVFNKNFLLTGIPMGSEVTKEQIVQTYQRKYGNKVAAAVPGIRSLSPFAGEVMWFGKYEGRRFDAIPAEYLTYLVNNIERTEKNNKIFLYYEQAIL